jgi:hypothetical protein
VSVEDSWAGGRDGVRRGTDDLEGRDEGEEW